MNTEAKVVAFGLPTSRRRSGQPLPAPLEGIREHALAQLRQGMQTLFDEVDDALFDMADRAENNQEQSLYFEAMRDLRLKRQGIERTFADRCAGGFESLLQDDEALPRQRGHAEHEARVADDAMVGKSLGLLGERLGRLSACFAALRGRALAISDNPLGPRALCDCFAEACSEADLPIRIKLIVLKLFERHCLGRLGGLCDEAIRELGGLVAAQPESGEEPQAPAAPGAVDVVEDDQVNQLRVGSWLEIRVDEAQKLRCKLAAFVKPTGRYIFVNRSGAKVLERTRAELAADFAAGAVRLLDDALIFDRALESVINLRRVNTEPN